ncbi:hypothetical protein OROHE_021533 [Orobanche hederae]
MALETPERVGSVRGCGHFVTHKMYFDTPNPTSIDAINRDEQLCTL